MKPTVYIAGAYTGEDYFEVDLNIMLAAEAAAKLANAGVQFFCPHLHSAHFEVITPEVPPNFWYELDIHFLKRSCNAILMLPGWENSRGSVKEHALAKELRMPIFYDINEAIKWAKGMIDGEEEQQRLAAAQEAFDMEEAYHASLHSQQYD